MSDTANPAPARRTTAVSQAFRQAGQFDRAQVSARAGLVAAIPVAAMLALGTAVSSPSAAVTMGVGAMLTGVAWRAGDGPLIPPLGTMTGAALSLAAATLAGTLSGHWHWVHLIVIMIFCAVAGTAASLGRPGLVIGTQSIIALIVFGRFPDSVGGAFVLTGLVIAGGLAQVLFCAIVAVPLAWRRQRDALADAYRLLGDLTAALLPQVTPPSAASAAAFEAADALLTGPAVFADPNRAALSALVREGRRIRLELIVLSTLIAQVGRTDPELVSADEPAIREALARIQSVFELTVIAITGYRAAAAELSGDAEALGLWGGTRQPLGSPALEERMAALIGQVTAVARFAGALPPPERGLRSIPIARPSLGFSLLARRLRYGLRRLRAGATLDSPAGRHALRLAIVVPLTELLAELLHLPRGYWAAVSASTVLRPGFGATFTRGAERVLGTLAGVVIASVIAVALDPTGWGAVTVVVILAYFTYAVFPANFAAGTAMLTGLVVFLLHAVAADSAQIAFDRGLDTAIGGAIGLVAYALWPTWSASSIAPLLARLVDAQRAYLAAVMDGLVSGRRPEEGTLRALARSARIAFADAESTIGLALSEPPSGHGDPRVARTTLGALRRVVYAVHALRLQSATESATPLPKLAALRSALLESLSRIAGSLREDHGMSPAGLPPLRRELRELARDGSSALSPPLMAELDELVDALNTAAATPDAELPRLHALLPKL